MLRGRAAEQDAIDGLLAAARAGVSGALVLRGEPGIGKTALLEYARERAGGIRVLRCAGTESEAALPYAGLHLVLRPILNHAEALSPVQRAALDGAFGRGGAPSDPFAIGAAVLALLAEAAETGPLLCLVDDAQWLDRSSVAALLFAARRLDREGVAVIFAARDHTETLVSTGLADLRLAGLAEADALALLKDYPDLTDERRQQLVAETQGNPLALLELPTVASASAGSLPLPLTSRVQDAFHHQVRALPPGCLSLLLVAAADDTGDLLVVLEAAGALGAGSDDLRPAEAAGLLIESAGTLSFRHPLVRSAVYHGAPLASRLAAHSSLAAVYGRQQDADRRAWHLAVAATGPDEPIAVELEAAADRAMSRGSFDTATSGYERAAQLGEDPASTTRRLVLACETALHGGRPGWARTRAERALPAVTDPAMQARLIAVRARAEYHAGNATISHDLLTQGATLLASRDPERAFWLVAEALHAAWSAPADTGLFARTVDQFGDVGLPPDHPLTSVAWLARWCTAAMLRRDTSAYPPLGELAERAEAAAASLGPRVLTEVANCTFTLGLDAATARIAARSIADTRRDGSVEPLSDGMGVLALCDTFLGRHRHALVTGTESARLAEHTGSGPWRTYAASILAYLSAVHGDATACLAQAEIVDTADQAHLSAVAWTQSARGLLDLGHGRVQDCFDRLSRLVAGPARHHNAAVRCIPDLVEAAARLDRLDAVVVPLGEFERWASVVRQPWVDGQLARCRALTATDAEAEDHFRAALSGLTERPFDQARTQLLYGEWLRRLRRKIHARTQLEAALRTFDDLGCTPWADRARAELSAAGATVPHADRQHVLAALTPQELQIAILAGQGMSNRDIAAQLYLSPRTVAYHLYKAYPKLGVTSRAALSTIVL